MHSKSFTGSSAASIDEFEEINDKEGKSSRKLALKLK
jgi:hypothetical protein